MSDNTHFKSILEDLQRVEVKRFYKKHPENNQDQIDASPAFLASHFEPESPEACDARFLLHQLAHNLSVLILSCNKISRSSSNGKNFSNRELVYSFYQPLLEQLKEPSTPQRNKNIDQNLRGLVSLALRICSLSNVAECIAEPSEKVVTPADEVSYTVKKVFFTLYHLQKVFYGSQIPDSMENDISEVYIGECMNNELGKAHYHHILVERGSLLRENAIAETKQFELQSIVSNVVINAITAINARHLADMRPASIAARTSEIFKAYKQGRQHPGIINLKIDNPDKLSDKELVATIKDKLKKQPKKPLIVSCEEKINWYIITFKNEGKLPPEKLAEIEALKNNTFISGVKGAITGVGIEECFRRSERIGITFDLQNVEEDGQSYVMASLRIPKNFRDPALEKTFDGEDSENQDTSPLSSITAA